MAKNPLGEYFRKPAVYVDLPSKGNYYENKPTLSADGELAVYGMTAKDELHLKNPDALLNGQGVITVLQSVVPDILNQREIPIPDFNSILIAMRIASFGKDMDYEITCSSCSQLDTVTFDLYEVLATTQFLDPEYIVKLDSGVEVYVGPTTVETQNKVSMGQLEQGRLIDLINTDLDSDEKLKKFSKIFEKITGITFDIVQDGIRYVKIPDEEGTIVKNEAHIIEWLKNITRDEYEKIQNLVTEINLIGTKGTYDHACTSCKHINSGTLEFDPTNFFV
jgi:hypothetical protein|tara:strand:+ start:1018 stop:1851 length:834 start_codon:yes stop_codon:yes gene_type:complete